MAEKLSSAAVVLAGGRGDRLGVVDKARLRVGGQTLLERVVERMQPQAKRVAVAISGGEVQFAGRDAVEVIQDAVSPPVGPVGGLAAAGAWAAGFASPSDRIITAPVDTPFFPVDFAARALPLLGTGVDVVVGAFGEDAYPVCALWRLAPLAALAADFGRGKAAGGVFAALDRLQWKRADYAQWVGENPFVNANTAADLVRLSERLVQALAAGTSVPGKSSAGRGMP